MGHFCPDRSFLRGYFGENRLQNIHPEIEMRVFHQQRAKGSDAYIPEFYVIDHKFVPFIIIRYLGFCDQLPWFNLRKVLKNLQILLIRSEQERFKRPEISNIFRQLHPFFSPSLVIHVLGVSVFPDPESWDDFQKDFAKHLNGLLHHVDALWVFCEDEQIIDFPVFFL